MTTAKHFEFGVEVRDIVTGWKGIVTARLEYINGCVQYGVKRKAKVTDNELKGAEFIDSQQLEYVGEGIRKKLEKPKPTGGDMGKDTPRC